MAHITIYDIIIYNINMSLSDYTFQENDKLKVIKIVDSISCSAVSRTIFCHSIIMIIGKTRLDPTIYYANNQNAN